MSLSPRSRTAVVVIVCLLAGLAGAAAQTPPPPPPPPPPQLAAPAPPTVGTAAISGVVVDGTTGKPVAGAIVSVSVGQRITLAGPTVVLADPQGRFVFTHLPAGNFSLTATKLGYTSGRYGQSDPANTTSARSITLIDGQWLADAKTSIWRPGSITGRVFDEAGEPMVGAFVRVVAEVFIAGRAQLATATAAKTDDRGVYRVAGLAAGKYVVMVPSVQATIPEGTPVSTLTFAASADQAGFATVDRTAALQVGVYPTPPSASGSSAYPVTFFPAARSIAEASAIDLHWAEDRTNVDVRMIPVRTVRIAGVIQGPADAGIGGMIVRLLPIGNESLGNGTEAATALVAADGTFTMLNVPAGNYTLIVSRNMMNFTVADSITASAGTIPQPPGYRGGSSGSGLSTGGSVRYAYTNSAGPSYAARMPLAVGDQNLNGVVVPLSRGVTMSGRIVPAETQGPGGAAGPPVPRTPLRLEPANGDPALGVLTGGVAADLTFKIDGLMPGPYVLRSLGVGGTIKSIEWEGRDYADRPFDAAGGQDIEGVVVTLTYDLARITGTVRTAAGASAGGAVIVFPTDPARWSSYGFTPPRIASTQAGTNGAFTVTPSLAGEYFVLAVDAAQSGAWRDPKFLEAAAPLATRVTVGWGETKSVDLSIVTVKVGR